VALRFTRALSDKWGLLFAATLAGLAWAAGMLPVLPACAVGVATWIARALLDVLSTRSAAGGDTVPKELPTAQATEGAPVPVAAVAKPDSTAPTFTRASLVIPLFTTPFITAAVASGGAIAVNLATELRQNLIAWAAVLLFTAGAGWLAWRSSRRRPDLTPPAPRSREVISRQTTINEMIIRSHVDDSAP
jgi:hypothetical protein